MRTTITINDSLLARLKRRASQTGSTVSRLIEDSVRLLLSGESTSSKPEGEFELVTFGAGGRFSTKDLDKTGALLAAEDIEKYGPEDRSPN